MRVQCNHVSANNGIDHVSTLSMASTTPAKPKITYNEKDIVEGDLDIDFSVSTVNNHQYQYDDNLDIEGNHQYHHDDYITFDLEEDADSR